MIPWTTIDHEDMGAWEVLSLFVTRDTVLPVLRALDERPAATAGRLVGRLDSTISRSTLDDTIEYLGKYGFVATTEHDSADEGDSKAEAEGKGTSSSERFETTLLGKYALDIYDDLVAALSVEGVEVLARSESAVPVLTELESDPTTPKTLERTSAVEASLTTINRRLRDLREQGWISRTSPYELTDAGKQALDTYRGFARDLECVIDRAELLQSFRLDPMAVEALHGTTIYEGSGSNPDAPTKAFAGAIHSELNSARGITPVVVKDYVDGFIPLVKAGASVELIMDEATIAAFRMDFPLGYALASCSSNVSLLVHPEPISFGIATLGDEEAWIGAYDSNGRHRATLRGTNDELLDWAHDQIDAHREQAYADPESVTTALWDSLTKHIPVVAPIADDPNDTDESRSLLSASADRARSWTED